MKIIYFNYICGLNANPAGALAKSTSYIRELQAMGHDIQVNWQSSYLKDGGEDPEHRFVKRGPFRRFLSRFVHEPKKLFQNIAQYISISRKISRLQPDIIFERLENYYFAAALAARRRKIPLAVEADAPVVYEYKKFYGRKNLHLPFLPEMIEMYTLRNAAAVFCISEEMKKYYAARGIDAAKIIVTPNGCNPRMFYPQKRHSGLAGRMNLDGQVVIGWVGSLYGWAGIDNLIRLAERLAEHYSRVSFMFVGGGKNEEIFREKLAGRNFSDRVHLPGAVPHDQINDYLSCMDIVLAPYPKLDFWYASSMKVFEYMGAGKAVVTSGIGQLKDIIQDGVNGLLYDPGDFADLEKKVTLLIEDSELRDAIGRQACRDVREHYTWDVLARKMDTVFKNIAAAPDERHK